MYAAYDELDFAISFHFFDQPTAKITTIDTQEKHLLKQLRDDDQMALKTIFMRHHEQLCRVAYAVVRDAEKSKDIVQDIFVKLWIKRKELHISTSLEAYLKRAVVNTAINVLQEVKTFGIYDDKSLNAVSYNDPGETHAFNELDARASEAIENLPPRTKAVFRLIRTEGMTYREVGACLSISEKAVEKEMMKALKLLREALKDFLVVLLYLKIFL